MIEKAIKFACEKHEGQLDKAGQPYIYHLLRVMLSSSVNEDGKCIAMLHDILEDTDTNILELVNEFDSKITAGVVCLSNVGFDSTYENYIKNLCNNTQGFEDHKTLLLIKEADLEDNMNILRLNEFEYNDFRRMNKYVKAHKQICEALKCT